VERRSRPGAPPVGSGRRPSHPVPGTCEGGLGRPAGTLAEREADT
jgi:hypothetical protein